jgi:hypothetical protein
VVGSRVLPLSNHAAVLIDVALSIPWIRSGGPHLFHDMFPQISRFQHAASCHEHLLDSNPCLWNQYCILIWSICGVSQSTLLAQFLPFILTGMCQRTHIQQCCGTYCSVCSFWGPFCHFYQCNNTSNYHCLNCLLSLRKCP